MKKHYKLLLLILLFCGQASGQINKLTKPFSFNYGKKTFYYDSVFKDGFFDTVVDIVFINKALAEKSSVPYEHVFLHIKGLLFQFNNNIDSSVYYFKTALDAYSTKHLWVPNEQVYHIGSYTSIGLAYWRLKNNDSSFHYLYAADSMANIYNDPKLSFFIKHVIAQHHRVLGQYKFALNVLNSGYKYLRYFDDRSRIAYELTTVSILNQYFTESRDPALLRLSKINLNILLADTALQKFRQALALTFSEEGFIHANFNRSDSALIAFKKAKTIFEELHLNNNVTDQALNELHIYFKQDRFADVIKLGNEVLRNIKDNKDYLRRIEVYSELAIANERMGNYKNAAALYHEFFSIKNEEDKQKYSKDLAELQQKYLTEKKESELKVIKAKQTNIEIESRGKTIRFYYLLVFFILVAVAFIFATVQFLNVRKAKQKVEEQKADLERINLLNQRIFTVISHDFKGPMMSLELLLKMQERLEMNAETFMTYTQNIRGSVKQANIVMVVAIKRKKRHVGTNKKAAPKY